MAENKYRLKKRINRRTTSAQFEKLVDYLEASPYLASGYPSTHIGKLKAKSEAAWNNIARSLNSLGPPKRTVPEWKKTWSDLRSRTRQNIAEINKCDLYLTEGRSKPLNALEFRVAKLCNLSTNNTSCKNIVSESTPNRRVAIVTPNFSSTLRTTSKALSASPSVPNLSSTPPLISSSKTVQKTAKKKISKQKKQVYAKEIELLRKQVATQEEMSSAMESQVKLAEEHSKSLNEIAEACKLIASSMTAFIKQLK